MFQFKQLERRSLKKIRASTGFEPVTSALPVRCCTNWAMKPHIGSEVNIEFISPVRSEMMWSIYEIIHFFLMNYFIYTSHQRALWYVMVFLEWSIIPVHTMTKNGRNLWRPSFKIGWAQLLSATEIVPKSRSLRVKRSPIRYWFRVGTRAIRYWFRVGTRAIRYRVNVALVWR